LLLQAAVMTTCSDLTLQKGLEHRNIGYADIGRALSHKSCRACCKVVRTQVLRLSSQAVPCPLKPNRQHRDMIGTVASSSLRQPWILIREIERDRHRNRMRERLEPLLSCLVRYALQLTAWEVLTDL
jgi:hypothetical protein